MGLRTLSPADHLAARQDGLVARWQAIDAGMTGAAWRWWSRDLRRLHDGVVLLPGVPESPRTRLRAATLTTPGSVLSHASAAGHWGLWRGPDWFVTISREGVGGPRRYDGLHIAHQADLAGSVVAHEGLPTTDVVRTIVDLWPHVPPTEAPKLLREARRRRLTDGDRVLAVLDALGPRDGMAELRRTVQELAALPLERCRSDAEACALVLLARAGRPLPEVNVQVAGFEADLVWRDLRRILELDGPQWHRFKEEDAARTAAWTAAGYTVERLSTTTLFARPESVLEVAPARSPVHRALP